MNRRRSLAVAGTLPHRPRLLAGNAAEACALTGAAPSAILPRPDGRPTETVQMTRASIPLPQARRFGRTHRRDAWWLAPGITFIYFLSFVVYSTWAAFQGEHYWYGGAGTSDGGLTAQYLSPFYSPTFYVDSSREGAAPLHHAWLGEWPSWLPKMLLGFLPVTPALLILWMPGGFRFTCYYYRGAYYKAFWMDPVNCAVGEPSTGRFRGENYRGERWFPLILQNVHRYFLYIALAFIVILAYDAVLSFIFVRSDASGHVVERQFGIGVGSLVITINVVLLAAYTLGCHSLRHLVGGGRDCVAASRARFQAWRCTSCLNRWHMQWAWISLFWVGFTDVYIRLCSMGVWNDFRIL
jgi:hypothetical protein